MVKMVSSEKVFALKDGQGLTVGNNRIVTRYGSAFHCTLHGNKIAVLEPLGANPLCRVLLDDAGYLTATTVKAMGEFMALFGVHGSASRAGGKLSARWKTVNGAWLDKTSDTGAPIEFTAGRY